MRLFTCGACEHTIFFENVRCTQCGHSLAYLPDVRRLSAIERVGQGEPALFTALASAASGQRYRLCANSTDYGVCNWAIPDDDPSELCESCRLNDVIPNLSKPENLAAWQRLEASKRRLFYSLVSLKLPIESREQRPNGLVFKFMEDGPDPENKVFTGHNDGEIVINIAEADDPFREKLRKEMREGYRTLLGHFRHEIGHYYWDRLVKDTAWMTACRALFGDEQSSYEEAMKQHYANPPPHDWPLRYVSSYATMHPWEDWAETWAHYLHMVDTLETAHGYGLVLSPQAIDGARQKPMATRAIEFDDFDNLLRAWVPVTLALNSLNRSMGVIDPYPFVLSTLVIEKLRFVHDVIAHANVTVKAQRELALRWDGRAKAALKEAEPQPSPEARRAVSGKHETRT